MPWFADVLRVVGGVTAPILIVSGVGTPLGLAIGAGTAALTNAAADAVENAEVNSRADAAADRARADADVRLRQQAVNASNEQARRVDEVNQQLAEAELPGHVITACQNGNLAGLADLLPRLTNAQFQEIGMTPLAACPSQEIRLQVLQALQAEQARRGI
jgi:hypothetical protein